MRNRKPLVTAAVLLAFGLTVAFVSMTNGSPDASAGSSTPTSTPCPIHEVPDPQGDGCIKVTQTVTPTFTPCPPDYEPGPKGGCALGTPPGFPTHTRTPCPTHQFPVGGQCATITPTFTATPCPTHKVPDTFGGSGCGTPTATPTSQRPWGAHVTLIDHYPSPAVSGQKKTWVFEVENVGSAYGCERHEVTLTVQLIGVSDSGHSSSTTLGCHDTTQVTVSFTVTAQLGKMVSATYHAQAGAQPGNTATITEFAVAASTPSGPPTVTPTRTCSFSCIRPSATPTPRPLGDFNCDGAINSIDAALVLRISAGLAVPLPFTGDGDVNHDGELNPLDAFLMLQYHAHLITGFP